MKITKLILAGALLAVTACNSGKKGPESGTAQLEDTTFEFIADRFGAWCAEGG